MLSIKKEAVKKDSLFFYATLHIGPLSLCDGLQDFTD